MRNPILYLCLIVSLLVFSQESFANEAEASEKKERKQVEKDLKYGISLSPTFSWLNVNHNDLQAGGACVNGGVGLHFEYDVFKVFSVISGVNFQLNGGYLLDSVSLNNTATKNNFRMTYSVVDVPFIARIKTPVIGNTIYYAQAGVSGGFRVFAHEYHKAATKADDNIKDDISNLINEVQFNSLFGVGAKFLVNKHFEVFTEVNYRSSLSEVASIHGYAKADRYSPHPVPHISSGNLVFSFGIQF